MHDPSPVLVAHDGRPELINLMPSREQVDELVERLPNRPVAALRGRTPSGLRSRTIRPWKLLRSCSLGWRSSSPSREPDGERPANLRSAGIALADDLGWEGLDPWLKAEKALGSAYAQQAMNDSSNNDTPDRRLDVTQLYWTWADVLGHNLRRFQKEGYKVDEMDSLRSHALGEVKRIPAKHGWPLPPTALPGWRRSETS